MSQIWFSATRSSLSNVAFGAKLQAWLKENGVIAPHGAIILALEDDGFAAMQIGPKAWEDAEITRTVCWIADQLLRAKPVARKRSGSVVDT